MLGCWFRTLALPLLSMAATGSCWAADQPLHLVVAVSGAADWQREGWTGRSAIQPGTTLRPGDLVFVGAGGRITLVCADLQQMDVVAPGGGVPCAQGVPPQLIYRGVRISSARSAGQAYPVLKGPRSGVVTQAAPTIRWKPVSGITTYDVRVEGKGVDWRSGAVQGSQLEYPAQAPRLAPGPVYQVTITGGGRSSQDEGVPGTGFTVASAGLLEQHGKRLEQVRRLGLDAVSRALVEVRVAMSVRLHEEALQTLSRDCGNGPACHRLRAEVLLATGPREDAVEPLRRFLAAAPAADVEGLAYAQSALAKLIAASQRAEAKQLLERAIAAYLQLGDKAAAEELLAWRAIVQL